VVVAITILYTLKEKIKEGKGGVGGIHLKFSKLTCKFYALQIFNDNMLKINVKRCIRTAIKLRKKYLYKVCYDLL
jgi:hypothetical protein